jgi:hypothetical protein
MGRAGLRINLTDFVMMQSVICWTKAPVLVEQITSLHMMRKAGLALGIMVPKHILMMAMESVSLRRIPVW